MTNPPSALWDALRSLWSCDLSTDALRTRLSEQTSLDFEDEYPGQDALVQLAEAPESARLEHLNLIDCEVDDALLARFAASPYLTSLQELHLWDTSVTLVGVQALMDSKTITGLHTLGLENLDLGPGLIDLLAASDATLGLRDLRIGANRLGLQGAQELASNPQFAGLMCMDLSANELGDVGLRALCRSPHLTSLHHLELSNNDVESWEDFANASIFTSLRSLRIEESDVGDEGIEAFARSPHLRGLEVLRLRHNLISGDALVRFIGSLESLRHLDIGANFLGSSSDDDCVALSRCAQLRRLELLDASHNGIWDRGASALATSEHLTSLETLDLLGNQIGDAGALALADRSNLPALRVLRLGRNEITDRGAQALAMRRPELETLTLSSELLSEAWDPPAPGKLDSWFGEVRSALQSAEVEESWLFFLLDRALECDPGAYASQWVPYLRDVPTLRDHAPFHVDTTFLARRVLGRLPFASLALDLGRHREVNWSTWTRFLRESFARRVVGVHVRYRSSNPPLWVLLEAANRLTRLEVLGLEYVEVDVTLLLQVVRALSLRELRLVNVTLSYVERAQLGEAAIECGFALRVE